MIKLDIGSRLGIKGLTLEQLHENDSVEGRVHFLTPQSVREYLHKSLPKSLVMKARLTPEELLREFVLTVKRADHTNPWSALYEGYGSERHHFTWVERVKGWSPSTMYLWQDKASKYWTLSTKHRFLKHLEKDESIAYTALPLFENYVNPLTVGTEPKKLTNKTTSGQLYFTGEYRVTGTEQRFNFNLEKEKTMLEKLKDQNIEAAKLAAKLTVGKTANGILADAVLARLPWYSRLFAGSALKDTSIAKLATANLAVVLSQHFGKGNENLQYVTDAMLQDAMVEVIRDGDAVKSILAQLSSLAGSLQNETK